MLGVCACLLQEVVLAERAALEAGVLLQVPEFRNRCSCIHTCCSHCRVFYWCEQYGLVAAIEAAVAGGDGDVVRELLSLGACPDAVLEEWAECGTPDMLHLLVDSGGNVNHRCCSGRLLVLECTHGRGDTVGRVKALLQYPRLLTQLAVAESDELTEDDFGYSPDEFAYEDGCESPSLQCPSWVPGQDLIVTEVGERVSQRRESDYERVSER